MPASMRRGAGRRAFVYITVSDEVPCNQYGAPICANLTDENEMWVSLIEKAFAKMCASFSATESGRPVWGMVYLCGGQGEYWDRQGSTWHRFVSAVPLRAVCCARMSIFMLMCGCWCQCAAVRPIRKLARFMTGMQVAEWRGGDGDQVDRKGNDEGLEWDNASYTKKKLWMAMTKYCDKNYPMGCARSIVDGVNDMGIINEHAYSLIAVREVKVEMKIIKLLKIRNPHGETEWQGDWSDYSSKWDQHRAVRDELNFKQLEDGCFWMSLTDFCRTFTTFSVCKRAMPLEGVHEDKINQMRARGLY